MGCLNGKCSVDGPPHDDRDVVPDDTASRKSSDSATLVRIAEALEELVRVTKPTTRLVAVKRLAPSKGVGPRTHGRRTK